MISHLINSFLISSLFADMIERRFPNEFRNLITNVTFKLIYIFSKFQISCNKSIKKLNEIIDRNPSLLKIKNDLLFYINPDSNKIVMIERVKNGEYINLLVNTSNFSLDFSIYSWLDKNTGLVNKRIIYNEEDYLSCYETSDIKFMLVEFKFGENNSHKIDLKTDKFNFYIVGNKFTKQFFIYYLKQILNIKEEFNDETKFSLKIIDHDVNTITVDFTDQNESIILDKNGYNVSITNRKDE